VQLTLQAAVLGLEGIERGRDLAGRQLFELVLPDFQALLVDAQLGGDLAGALAADQPVFDGGTFEGFLVSAFESWCWGVVHVRAAQLTLSPAPCPPNRGKTTGGASDES
jgi:hypothetical protein